MSTAEIPDSAGQLSRARRWFFFAVAAFVGLAAAGSLSAGENYAFLVAVGEYDRSELTPLKYTRADIQEFRQALIDSGFKPHNVVHLHDDTATSKGTRFLSLAANIREEFALLLSGLEKGDTLIVAFAGHGIQFKGEKESYFCPRDARLAKKETLVSFADVLKQMDGCPASRKLLLVDACRNDPQSAIARSRAEVNLESVTRPQSAEVPKSLLAFFSCGPGQQSFEDPDLGHGIFFHHILKGWQGDADGNQDGRLEFDELQTYVRRETKEYARVALKVLQTPQFKGEASDEWVLRTLKVKRPVDADGFTSLFDGKSLDGWDGDPDFWSVEDGAITGRTTEAKRAANNTCLIWRGGETEDFELKLEYKIEKGNSGIQYRSFEVPGRKWVVGGYQADFEAGDFYSGTNFGELFRGILAARGKSTELIRHNDEFEVRTLASIGDSAYLQSKIRKDDWNEYHILAKGFEFTHRINGSLMSKCLDSDERERRASGILALQIHAGVPMKVQFRKIRIKQEKRLK